MVEERKIMGCMQLYHIIKNFIDDHYHSRNVDERWLCSQLKLVQPMISETGNSSLTRETRRLVSEFRAAEIESDLQQKQKEIEALERQLGLIRRDLKDLPENRKRAIA